MRKQMMVVLSGGQDSTTCLAWAKTQAQIVRAVTFNYGQRHQAEIESASTIAQMLGIESHDIIDVPNILRSRSPLTSDTELETYTDFESMDKIIGDRVEVTFVPMRNAFFLTLAANISLSYDCYDLVTGVCQQDNANYPDCRGEFIDAQEATINEALGLSAKFEIHTPLLDLTKAESIELAKTLPGAIEALAYSHTCYAGEVPPCGKCHACVLRAYGFAQANTPDPLVERFK